MMETNTSFNAHSTLLFTWCFLLNINDFHGFCLFFFAVYFVPEIMIISVKKLCARPSGWANLIILEKSFSLKVNGGYLKINSTGGFGLLFIEGKTAARRCSSMTP